MIEHCKQILMIVSGMLLSVNTIAQNVNDGIKKDRKTSILYILKIEGKSPKVTEFLIIDPMNVDSLSGLSGKQNMEIYNLLNVSTIWVVKPKDGTHFLNLISIFNLFNIIKEDQSLPLRIDNWVVDNPESIIVQREEVLKIEVANSDVKNRFINIITKHPLEQPIRLSRSGIIFH